MRVRAAGALLLAPLLAVTYVVMQGVGRGGNGNTIVKALFWDGAGSYQPKAWLVVRDGIFFAVLVIAIVAICGPRFSRWLVALAGVGLIVLYVPWVIYDYYNFSGSRPPNWLVKNYPWYLPVRTSAIMWIVVLALAVLLALTDRDPRLRGRPSHYMQPPQPVQPTQQFAPQGYPPPPGAGPSPAAAQWQQPHQPPPQGYAPTAQPQAPEPQPEHRPTPSAPAADRPAVADPPTQTYAPPPSPPAAPSADDPTQVQPQIDPNDR